MQVKQIDDDATVLDQHVVGWSDVAQILQRPLWEHSLKAEGSQGAIDTAIADAKTWFHTNQNIGDSTPWTDTALASPTRVTFAVTRVH